MSAKLIYVENGVEYPVSKSVGFTDGYVRFVTIITGPRSSEERDLFKRQGFLKFGEPDGSPNIMDIRFALQTLNHWVMATEAKSMIEYLPYTRAEVVEASDWDKIKTARAILEALGIHPL